MKLAIRRPPSSMRLTDSGARVSGLRLRSDAGTVQNALERHIASQVYSHGGVVNENCSACRELLQRMK
jgi:hypothetical protein